MRILTTLDELRELLEVTQQRVARAASAQQGADRYVDHYRIQAEEFKKRAALARWPEMRARLLRIAASQERLVRLAKGGEAREDPSNEPDRRAPPPDDLRDSRIAAEPSEEGSVRQRSSEDPIAQARRHVAEAEGHIARQEALVVKLSGDERHIALAAEARDILATLKQTLRLAREHLALELKK